MKKSKYIDHTLLKPQSTKAQILKLCDEALEYDFASVCVNPSWVKTCAEKLKDSDVMVCTVIGFPLGATTSETKAFETKQAIANGADEVDMVMNIGALIDGDTNTVIKDIINPSIPQHNMKITFFLIACNIFPISTTSISSFLSILLSYYIIKIKSPS